MTKVTTKKRGKRRERAGVNAGLVPGELSGPRPSNPIPKATIKTEFYVFQNRQTNMYRWLSLETAPGTDQHFLCESTIDIPRMLLQKPAGCNLRPASHADYQNAVQRIQAESYVIVKQG